MDKGERLQIEIAAAVAARRKLDSTDMAFMQDMDDAQWICFFKGLCRQRLQALLWDVCDPESLQWSRRVQAAWAVGQIEDCYRKRLELQPKVVGLITAAGLECIPLKGLGVAGLYANAAHRPFNDIDLYVPGGVREACNVLALKLGAQIMPGINHHDKAVVDGVAIELHRSLCNLEKYKSNRVFQRHMDLIRQDGDMVTFHMLFLLHHAALHFVSAELSLLNVVDIALFKQKHYESIDWNRVGRVAADCGFTGFLTAVTEIAGKWNSVQGTALRVLSEIVHPYESPSWGGPLGRTVYMLRTRWKHRLVHEHEHLPGIWLRTVRFWMKNHGNP